MSKSSPAFPTLDFIITTMMKKLFIKSFSKTSSKIQSSFSPISLVQVLFRRNCLLPYSLFVLGLVVFQNLHFFKKNAEFENDQKQVFPILTTHSNDYDLPFLLNIRGLFDPSSSVYTNASRAFPNSLAFRYTNQKPHCSLRPFRSHLHSLVHAHSFDKSTINETVLQIVSQKETLSVQLCLNGDEETGWGDKYIKRITNCIFYEKFSTVVIVPCPTHSTTTLALQMENSFKSMFKLKGVIISQILNRTPSFMDTRLLLFHRAYNIIVDSRSFDGALAALISTSPSGVYIDSRSILMSVNEFRHLINRRPQPYQKKLPLTQTLDGLYDVKETCCNFTEYGKGDGAKVLCENAFLDKNKCWVLSIGCSNRWDFEVDVVSRSKCSVHVFDCTGSFIVPEELQGRVTIDHICIGDEKANRRKGFRTWSEIMDIGAKRAGMPQGTPPEVVKMDVEGWEFPVLRVLGTGDNHIIPKQMVIEVHAATNFEVGHPYVQGSTPVGGKYWTKFENVKAMVDMMNKLGFELIHRADNPFCGHCSEVNFMQRSAIPNMI